MTTIFGSRAWASRWIRFYQAQGFDVDSTYLGDGRVEVTAEDFQSLGEERENQLMHEFETGGFTPARVREIRDEHGQCHPCPWIRTPHAEHNELLHSKISSSSTRVTSAGGVGKTLMS
jgi:hypothetical protein